MKSLKSVLRKTLGPALGLLAGLLLALPHRGEPDCALEEAGRPDLAEAVAYLQERLPLSKPVRVDVQDLRAFGLAGYATWDEDEYLIVLDARTADFMLVAVLVHEYAHLLVFEDQAYSEGHGTEWGIAVAKVWRTWVGER